MKNKKLVDYKGIFINLAVSATKIISTHVAEICTQKYNETLQKNNNYQPIDQDDFDEQELITIQKTAQSNAQTAHDMYSSLLTNDDTDDVEERPSF